MARVAPAKVVLVAVPVFAPLRRVRERSRLGVVFPLPAARPGLHIPRLEERLMI